MKLNIKKLLREYLEENMISLKDYFNMSDEEKIMGLLYDHNYFHFFDDFLTEKNIKKPNTNGESMNDIEFIEWLQRNNQKLWLKFGEWLLEKVNNRTLDMPEHELPTWAFYGSPELIKNQWLIHFTDNAIDIASEGFTKGVSDMTRLGITTGFSTFEKKYGGYNFAFTLNEFDKYGRIGNSYHYGNEAVIFRASGLKVWHFDDRESQVIFYGKTATNIIPIIDGENANFGVFNSKTGRFVYENDKLENVVNWLVKNFIQYRKKL